MKQMRIIRIALAVYGAISVLVPSSQAKVNKQQPGTDYSVVEAGDCDSR